jgi:basic amino acid/polyamine antiporter, APA family
VRLERFIAALRMKSWRQFIWERVPLELARTDPDMAAVGGGLVRSLGPAHLTLMGVGCAIGAGIFVLTGTAAARYAGPAVSLSYAMAGVVCLLTCLCYAELSAVIPAAGGSFSYARITLGRLPAWLIGCCMVFEYLAGGSNVAVGWSAYAQNLLAQFGLVLPWTWSGAPLEVVDNRLVPTGRIADLPAALMSLGCTLILLRGLRGSALANSLMVAVNIVVILAVIIVGAFYVNPQNWVPFMPARTPSGHFGVAGVFTAAAIAFYSYTGFEATSNAARECRNPSRDVPVSLLASAVICALLYTGIAFVMTGLAPYPKLDTASPIATALALASPKLNWLIMTTDIGTVLGLGAAVLISFYSQSRIFYSMAVVGNLPPSFARIHPRTRTPTLAVVWTGLGAALVAGVLPIELLAELISLGTLIAYASVCAGVLVLRRIRPDVPRPFRVPLCPWIPLAALATCSMLMVSLPRLTWLNMAAWIALCIVLFFILAARSGQRDMAPVISARD